LNKRIIAATIALWYVLAATAVSAARDGDDGLNTAKLNGWLSQKTATGNWAGFRHSLENAGIFVSSNYITDISGNPAGGLKQVAKYSGFLSLAAAFDFEKIVP